MAARSNLPGVKKLPRANGRSSWFWVASQLARRTKGFRPRTRFLWSGLGEPNGEILKAIEQECSLLTGNLRAWEASGRVPPPVRSIRMGTIYFVANADGMIKIGFSRDLKSRLSALQVGSASPHRLIATLAGSNRMEGELKHRFRRLRVRGEWHRAEKVLLDFIAAEAAAVSSAQAA